MYVSICAVNAKLVGERNVPSPSNLAFTLIRNHIHKYLPDFFPSSMRTGKNKELYDCATLQLI